MTPYNDTLYHLQKQVDRAAQLRTLIPELRQRYTQQSAHVKALRKSMQQEQRDVDKLEGKTLTALYHHAAGTLEYQLDKERKEARSTREQHDLAAAELRALQTELERSEAELAALEGCETQFQSLLAEKLTALKARGGEIAENIHSMERRISKLELQKKEIQEARLAGNALLRSANQIQSCLDGAKAQSIGDLASNGIASELFDFGKHSSVNEAVSYLGDFRDKLSAFQYKLAKITVTTGIRIDLDEFRHLGHCFETGFSADYAFHTKLKSAQAELENSIKKIDHTIARLDMLADKLVKDQDRMRAKLNKLILKAP